MHNYTLEDVVMVPTQCKKCQVKSTAPTFKQILKNKESILTRMIDDLGYVEIVCTDCQASAAKELQ